MDLNGLLRGKNIEPEQVMVMRHRPSEPEFNKVFPWLAAERHDLFNAYQQTQNEKVEKAMQGAKYIASFIGREPGKALFIGLYAVNGWKPMSYNDCAQLPITLELNSLGMRGFSGENVRPTILWFDLTLTDFYIFDTSDGKGYVGSAYGEANLLGRWLGYAAVGHGGNRFLRQREPKDFRFSILQRVSPDMDAGDVIRLEGTWKERLHTRQPFGLNDN